MVYIKSEIFFRRIIRNTCTACVILLVFPGIIQAKKTWVSPSGLKIEQFLSQYIQQTSYSGQEKKAGIFLREICKKEGLHVTQMGDSNGNFNFAASIFPLEHNKPNIVFLNHIDVVHEGNTDQWTHPPFHGIIKDSLIWGRGAYDNKGMAAMQLYSILSYKEAYKNNELPYNITMLSVSCEETQCEGGAAFVVKNYLKTLNPVLVLGEGPPSLNNILKSDPERDVYGVSLAHKRILWLKLDLAIKNSGHASVTPEIYSNQEMVKALHRLSSKKPNFVLNELNTSILRNLGKYEKGITAFALRNPRLFKPLLKKKLQQQPELYALFVNSTSITNIQSESETYNVIPQKTSAYLDCRLLPETDEKRFIEQLRKTLNTDKVKIKIVKSMEKMKPSSPNTKFYASLKKVMLKHHAGSLVIPAMMPNCNDCGIFRSHGVLAYATNLFKIEHKVLHTIHNTDEHIPLAAIEQGAEIYFDYIKELQDTP